MSDQVLGFDQGGNTVFRRADGTHYVRDAILSGVLECIGPGQTLPPRQGTSYSGLDGTPLVGYVATTCPSVLAQTAGAPETLGADFLQTRVSILDFFPQTPLGTSLETSIYAAANAGPGLLALLEAQTPEALQNLKATLDAETERQKLELFPILAKIKSSGEKADSSFDLGSALETTASFVANPVGTYVQLALKGVAQQVLEAGPINLGNINTFRSDPRSPFFDPAALRDEQQTRAFVDAYNARARENLMGFFDSLGSFVGSAASSALSDIGISNVGDFGGLNLSPDIFDTAGSPDTASTTGGALDGLGDFAGSILAVLGRTGALGKTGQKIFGGGQAQTQAMTPTMSAMGAGGSALGLSQEAIAVLKRVLAGAAGGAAVDIGMDAIGNMSASKALSFLGLGGGSSSRYVRVDASDAGLTKSGNSREFIPRRIFADLDGVPYVLYNAGPATIGANERSLVKSIAKRNCLKVVRQGSGGGYRRRRPR